MASRLVGAALALGAVGFTLAPTEAPRAGASVLEVRTHILDTASATANTSLSPLDSAGARVMAYPGATTPAVVDIVNRSASARRFRIRPSGLVSINGQLQHVIPAPITGPASWVRVPDREIVVPRESSIPVHLTLTVPSDASAGDHAAGLIVDDLDAPPSARRATTPLYVKIPGERRQHLMFRRVSLTSTTPVAIPFRSRPAMMTYELINDGNAVVHGNLEVGVESLFGLSGATQRRANITIFPGGSVSGQIPVTILPTVTVKPHAVISVPFVAQAVQYFSDEPLVETYQVEASGETTVLAPAGELAIALTTLGGGWLWWLRARRRALRTRPQR
ncbi:hypothetical protein [Gordonia crocea]|uniref:DUF916 domain-containing protein n=1 Tax=Gordonia crocea TaxID=589162 RepID=A0A7I9V0D6_9ACTN|nr:hypothetical protein [Gordonia crocea]GED98569.1 hypothetical protein nbrc107697_26080 [Gordonia crocea]